MNSLINEEITSNTCQMLSVIFSMEVLLHRLVRHTTITKISVTTFFVPTYICILSKISLLRPRQDLCIIPVVFV